MGKEEEESLTRAAGGWGWVNQRLKDLESEQLVRLISQLLEFF